MPEERFDSATAEYERGRGGEPLARAKVHVFGDLAARVSKLDATSLTRIKPVTRIYEINKLIH